MRTPLKVGYEWFDSSEKKYHRRYQLEPSRLYFQTVYTSEDEEFLGYSFDVEEASDSHYQFGVKGEKRLRRKLGYEEDDGTLAEVLVDYFSKGGSGAVLENAAYLSCDRCHHFFRAEILLYLRSRNSGGYQEFLIQAASHSLRVAFDCLRSFLSITEARSRETIIGTNGKIGVVHVDRLRGLYIKGSVLKGSDFLIGGSRHFH